MQRTVWCNTMDTCQDSGCSVWFLGCRDICLRKTLIYPIWILRVDSEGCRDAPQVPNGWPSRQRRKAKIRKSLIGRSRPVRGNYVLGDLVYCWRAATGVRPAQGQWLGPVLVIGIEAGNVWVSQWATAIKCAKEQLRVASPAEREMREMLMRKGGDDPDERSKHGVPRQQDLTQQQPPPQSPPQEQKPRKDPRQQQFHQEPEPQVKPDASRQEPAHQRQESRPNQEPQQTPRHKKTSSNAR